MIYEVLKAAHITAVIVWVSGITVAALSFRYPGQEALPVVRKFDRWVTTPAMLLAWAFGISLAVYSGWFGAAWLWGKLVLVITLSGLHGVISGRLRRMDQTSGSMPNGNMKFPLPVGFGLLVSIIFLVTTKAF